MDMDTIFKYINPKIANEVVKTIAVLVTAIATSLAAYYSYQAVQESRIEAANAREYAFFSEKRLMIGRLKAAAVSLIQADRAYEEYCCLGLLYNKKINPELTLRYSQNILNAANNFLTLLIEAGAYNLVKADYYIEEMNKWIGVLPYPPGDKPHLYSNQIDELIVRLDSEYKNLTGELNALTKSEG